VASAPTPTPRPVNIITNAVTAKDVQADNFDPVGITDSFPADESIFHAVVTISGAPDNTDFGVVWLTTSGSKMGSFDLKSGGSRNLDFTFKPDAGKLPAGNYKVEIDVNGKLNRTLNFSVSGTAQAQPTVPSSGSQPSGYITQVVMAKDTQGDNKDPVNPTEVFASSATFHAVVSIQDAPANSLIDSTDLTTDGSRNIDFTLKPNSKWPAGTYRVEISVNGVVDTVKTFSVK